MPNLPNPDNSKLLAKLRESKTISVGKVKSVVKKSNKLSTERIAATVKRSAVPRLLFTMDATASREASWSVAKEITEGMFNAVPNELEIGLGYHGGSRVREMSSFTTDRTQFISKIRTVTCLGGITALNEILEFATEVERLKIIIYIGDCYEENLDAAIPIVKHLALKGVCLFIFHDTNDVKQSGIIPNHLTSAHESFETLAKAGKGAVFPFDVNSPQVVASILAAIAYYASRGLQALKQLDTPGAKKLLTAMGE